MRRTWLNECALPRHQLRRQTWHVPHPGPATRYPSHPRSRAYTSRSPQWISERADRFERRYRTAGLRGVLGDLLEQTSSPAITHLHSDSRAAWFMLLGKHNSAIHELETAVLIKPPRLHLIYLAVDPLFDPLRSAPRFRALLRRMRLGA